MIDINALKFAIRNVMLFLGVWTMLFIISLIALKILKIPIKF